MRTTFRISLLAIGLASLLAASAASAGSALVKFPNLPGQKPTSLAGYLALPAEFRFVSGASRRLSYCTGATAFPGITSGSPIG